MTSAFGQCPSDVNIRKVLSKGNETASFHNSTPWIFSRFRDVFWRKQPHDPTSEGLQRGKGRALLRKNVLTFAENVRAFPQNFLDFPDGSERNGAFHGNAVAFVRGSVLENSCSKVSERCGYCLFRALECLSTPSRKQKDAVLFFGETKCYSSKTSLCVSPAKPPFV